MIYINDRRVSGFLIVSVWNVVECVCVRVCMFVCTYVCVHACMCECVCTCGYVRACVCACMLTCVYVFVCPFLSLSIISGVIWHDMNPYDWFYNFYNGIFGKT